MRNLPPQTPPAPWKPLALTIAAIGVLVLLAWIGASLLLLAALAVYWIYLARWTRKHLANRPFACAMTWAFTMWGSWLLVAVSTVADGPVEPGRMSAIGMGLAMLLPVFLGVGAIVGGILRARRRQNRL